MNTKCPRESYVTVTYTGCGKTILLQPTYTVYIREDLIVVTYSVCVLEDQNTVTGCHRNESVSRDKALDKLLKNETVAW